MKKIKLLMYTTIFSSGGAEKTVLDIANNLDNNKYIIYLVIGRKNFSSYYQFLKKSENIHYINFGLGDNEDYKIPDLLSKTIDEKKPDICFSPGIFTNFILMDALSKAHHNPKVVLRESGYTSARNLLTEMENKITEQYNKADKVIAITKGIKNDLIKNYKVSRDKFELIHNPLDIADIEQKSLKNESDTTFDNIKGIKMVSVGRLVPVKGHKLLLKAFKIVSEQIENVNLIILGRGELETELKQLVSELELDNKVYFLGFKDNPYYYMKKCDLYVMSSRNEGFPHTLVEAMHLKVPVISTNCKTEPKDILGNNRYGYLVNVGDVNDMANKIIKLLKSKRKLKRKVNRAYKRTFKYESSKIINEYDKVFKDLIN